MRRHALIVTPEDGDPVAAAIQNARLYNLGELFELAAAKEGGPESGWDVSTKPGERAVGLVVLIDRAGRRTFEPTGVQRLAQSRDVRLDWADIDHALPDVSPDVVAALSDPRGATEPGIWQTLQQLVGSRADEGDSRADFGLPRIIASAERLLAVWSSAQGIESESFRRPDMLEAYPRTGPGISYAVAANGRLVAQVRDSAVELFHVVAAGEEIELSAGAHGRILLPAVIGAQPRVLTVAGMSTGAVRLSLESESDTWRVFVEPDGRVAAPRPVAHAVDVRFGLDVFSEDFFYRGDGRPVIGTQGHPFSGDRVRLGDVSVAGGVAVAAAITEAGGLTVRRLRDFGTWEQVDVSAELERLGLETASFSDVTVERRIDGSAPHRLAVSVATPARTEWIRLPEIVSDEVPE